MLEPPLAGSFATLLRTSNAKQIRGAIAVLYPVPQDVDAFEQAFTREHSPMVTTQNFASLTRFVAAWIAGTPDGSAPPFHRSAELHFSSLSALQSAAGSSSAQQVVAHAFSISSGEPP